MLNKLKNFKIVLGYKSAVALAFFVAGMGTMAAFASIPDASGTIHTCYRNTLLSKTFRVIDSPSQNCNSGETPLNWNQTSGGGSHWVVARGTIGVSNGSYVSTPQTIVNQCGSNEAIIQRSYVVEITDHAVTTDPIAAGVSFDFPGWALVPTLTAYNNGIQSMAVDLPEGTLGGSPEYDGFASNVSVGLLCQPYSGSLL